MAANSSEPPHRNDFIQSLLLIAHEAAPQHVFDVSIGSDGSLGYLVVYLTCGTCRLGLWPDDSFKPGFKLALADEGDAGQEPETMSQRVGRAVDILAEDASNQPCIPITKGPHLELIEGGKKGP